MGAAGIAWMMAEVTLPTRSCSHRCRQHPVGTSVTFSSGSPRAGQSWWQDTHQPRLAPLQLLAALLAESPERLPLPLRSRSFREPCPEEVALAAEAQQLHDRLPPGHPARQLYDTLRDRAHADIAPAEEADRALVEG